MSKKHLALVGLVIAAGGAAYGAHVALSPRRAGVTQQARVASPEVLGAHCHDAVGSPRVEKISDRVWVAIGYDLANTILIKTDVGNVVVDVGMSPARASEGKAALLREAPGPTAAIIYTHSHIDHVGGASAWLAPGVDIWATDAFVEHFVKQYGELRQAESARGARQFGAHIDDESLPCSAIGRKVDIDAAAETGVRMPTKTFTGQASLLVGGVRIELVEAHGETHDQLFVWLPDERVLMPGDNYYRAFPNLYTIRGTSPRPIDAWIASLDAMRRRRPEHLVPSHTVPLHGEQAIGEALTRYRDAIQWVRDRTVQGANEGTPVDVLAERVGLPPSLSSDPALAPMYGQIDWSVKAIYNSKLGWFDGRPEALYPMATRDRASRTVAMMGGEAKVWAAIEAEGARDPRWAVELLSLLRDAGLSTTEVGGRWALAMAKALDGVAAQVGNTNGRGYLLESSLSLRQGAPPSKEPRAGAEVLDAIPLSVFFKVMASRLLPELSQGVTESVTFELSDPAVRDHITIRNGVAEVVEGDPLPGMPRPIATVKAPASTWRRVATGAVLPAVEIAAGRLVIEGDATGFYTFTRRFRQGL